MTRPPAGRYEVLATPEARRHLGQLPPKVLHAALALVNGPLADDPRRVAKPLVGDLAGLWSARRADYRVVYEIDEEARAIIVHRVQHRRAAYRAR